MAEAEDLQQQLIQAQNADGGWSYGTGKSWTEPTALSLLALEASSYPGGCSAKGRQWLLKVQNSDGGWPPCSQVKESTWVTSLAILSLSESDAKPQSRGLEWLIQSVTPGRTLLQTLAARFWHIPEFGGEGGVPWFPGTAPWVVPTAMSILAFKHLAARLHAAPVMHLAMQGQRFLLSRRCGDHGWNHGGSFYRSEHATSYPETTGIALLALTGVPAPELVLTLERAQKLSRKPGSGEGLSWLKLAMYKHQRIIPADQSTLPCRNNSDVALRLLSLLAASSTNKFVV